MKKKNAPVVAVLWVLLQAQAVAATQPTVPGCPYIAAPADSLVVEGNHYLPGVVIWPRSFPPAYSGCAYLWMGTRLHSIARFENATVVEGVIDDLIKGVFDDSDLPPMVYCKAVDQPGVSNCERFRQLWSEEFPQAIGDINKRSKG